MVQVKGVNRNRLKYLKYSEFGFVSQPHLYNIPGTANDLDTNAVVSCHPRLQGRMGGTMACRSLWPNHRLEPAL
jgi:hypothetical protein